ncbi:MAG: YfhO family protein, partial [Anaerolineae bacterium]
ILALGLVIGLGLAAIQLVPTLELSALSPRANGMTYREVVSFSLKPQWLPWALLPAYGQNLAARFGTVAYAEYVAYLGVSGLLLAMWGARVGKRWRWPLLALALGGLALAVGAYNPLYYLAYRVIPGWALFRAPARWLLLYTAGMAGLIAVGVDALQARAGQRPRLRWLIWAGGALLVVELLVASNLLPHTHPTAPAAVTSLRNAPAYLLSEPGLWRFLSMSGITYDPGDQADLAHLFAGQLDPAALYDLIVASKQKEIVAPNLPLLWRLSSVDGYDGGVLPLTRYVDLQRLFVPDDQLAPDGRLREQLRRVPPAPLLDLLNTRFIITDKVFDVWVDNVYYDLQFSAPLAAGETWRQTLPADQPFEATALGVMSHLAGAASLADGTPVAAVRVQAADGRWTAFTLRAGQDTAEGSWRAGAVAHQPARSAHPWRDHADGQDYLTVLTLTAPSQIVTVEVTGTAPGSDFVLQGVSLIDVRTGSSQALITPAQGDWRRVHSGDVKIYEKRDVLPRAYVAPATGVIEVADAAAALEALRRPDFAPGQQVVLEADRSLPAPVAINRDASSGQATAAAAGRAVIERYAPEQVVISATLTAPGILVLSDTHYPGWRATVDGAPVRIEQANLLFRGLRLAPGVHRVVFDFAPASLMQGQRITFITFITFITLLGLGVWFLLRSRISNLPS